MARPGLQSLSLAESPPGPERARPDQQPEGGWGRGTGAGHAPREPEHAGEKGRAKSRLSSGGTRCLKATDPLLILKHSGRRCVEFANQSVARALVGKRTLT